MVPVRFLVALALGGMPAALGLTEAAPPAPAIPAPADTFGYRLPTDVHYVGNLSCASAACHAAGHAGGKLGTEYTLWAGGDPHFRAYEVLKNERSRTMVRLLHGPRPGEPTRPDQDRRCLSCHSPAHTAGAAPADQLPDRGVGCESCHGPAERWLTAHYQSDFKARSRKEKAEQYGLYPTKDLAFRVTLCASCHVGDAGREVDHDLIAAGHPRLAFEYTGYHHDPTYYRHWDERSYGPDFDARAWEIGQVACARSAAKLLAARAANKGHPWPELSEYSCYACHQKVTPGHRWKPVTEAADRKPGSLPWGTWYFSAVHLEAGQTDRSRDVMALAGLMESPATGRDGVPAAAEELAARLDARLRQLQAEADDWRDHPYPATRLADRFARTARSALTPNGQRFRDLDWDGVTQHYLGAAAYYYAWGAVNPAGRDARVRPVLGGLAGALRFPKDYNSPAGTDPARVLDLFRRLDAFTRD